MTGDRFLVFVREGQQSWQQVAALDNMALAIHEANTLAHAFTSHTDRAAVMEVKGVDVAPMFNFAYLVKK